MSALPARAGGSARGTLIAWAAACLSVLLFASAAGPVRAQTLAPIPAMTSPVVDTTGTLDAATRSQLEAQARALQQRKGSQLQVLVVASTAPEDIDSYAVRAYEQFKLGRKDVDDGVLLVVAKDDRRVRIEVGYGLEGAITDAQSGRIIQEYLAPKFRSGDYAGGLVDATAMLVKLIDGEPLPPPMARPAQDDGNGGEEGWVLAFFIAIFGGQVVRAVLGRLPALVRGLASGLVVGGIAWLLALAWWLVGLTALIGLFVGLLGGSGGQFVRSGGWGGYGGGGWGGGSGGGGGGGGGWSGGGGSSGGGGASGSW
ncbi:TPM domain-containing protein [Lysobacter sp. CA196]|uniref:TPM domain-containing protein n=1 Tax=Lysobacter sp. CA196 TaxID=3455606 RepID=UPI003F8D237D